MTFTAPTTGTGTERDQSVVYLDEDGIADAEEHLRNDTMNTFTGCLVRVC